MEEKYKVKEQYNIEKANEEVINMELELIMQNSPTQKDLVEFIQKIREYRTRIYELKMQLKGNITEAYIMKEGTEFIKFKSEKYDIMYAYNNRKESIGYGGEINLGRKKVVKCESREDQHGRKNENRSEASYIGILEEINIMKIARIFEYYEEEISFWQEMNLRRMMEIDEGEHYLE